MFKTSGMMLSIMLFTFAIGIAMSLQTSINAQLKSYLHSPLQASLLSFSIGTLCLLILVILHSAPWPQFSSLQKIPWYLWLGGVLGVYAISMSLFAAPKLGFLAFTGLVIFGQMLMSFLLDHFGWLDTPKIPLSWQRIVGAVLIFAGVLLAVQR